MLKKTITYEDYDGNSRTETFHFGLNKAELAKMEMSTTGGLTNMLNRIMEAQDGPAILKVYEEFIDKSYGEKSLDGKRFVKVDDAGVPLVKAFKETEAYSQLFLDVMTDADKAAEFMIGVLPNDMQDEVKKEFKKKVPEISLVEPTENIQNA